MQSKGKWYNNPKWRSLLYQSVLIAALLLLAAFMFNNALINLQTQNIRTGFDFLSLPAGFSINQTLIDYVPTDNYTRVFLVGILNTLLVVVIAIFLSTILGFIIGIARFSKNWLINKVALVYVEIIRNVPLLLQIFVWYFGVLGALPNPRQSISVFGIVTLNLRGILLPKPLVDGDVKLFYLAIFGALVLWSALIFWSKRRQQKTGKLFTTWPYGLALLIVIPGAVWLTMGMGLSFEMPELKGFNFVGGINIRPELLALTVALSTYTASFISEIVRAGIKSVDIGQWEAASSLGVRQSRIMRLIVIPQALRVIIPPLASQYLNITKNSTLAIAIGYPDLVAVFAGTSLNQTGQAIEIIFITMMVYLGFSLFTSVMMNWFNAKMALKSR